MSNSPALELHDLLLRFQRKHRLVALNKELSKDHVANVLGLGEMSVLRYLAKDAGQSVTELSSITGIERSWISRITTRLSESKYLKGSVSAKDRRSKRYSITPKGTNAIKEVDAHTQSVMTEALRELSAEEVKNLAGYLHSFADGLGADTSLGRESVYRALGRISRSLGLYESNVFGLGINLTQIHILHSLSEERAIKNISELENGLPFDMSTISRSSATLEKQKLVMRQRGSSDRREFELYLTDSGTKLLHDYRSQMEARLDSGIGHLSKKDLKSLLDLLAQAIQSMPCKRSNVERVYVQNIAEEELGAVLADVADSFGVNLERSSFSRPVCQAAYRNSELKAVVISDSGNSRTLIADPELNDQELMNLLRSVT